MTEKYGVQIRIVTASYEGDGEIKATIKITPGFALASNEKLKPMFDALCTMIATSMEAEQLDLGSALITSAEDGSDTPTDVTLN